MYKLDGSDFQVNRVYRHFKGKFYYVIALAKHTETEELMVVYQTLYGDYDVFTRPYLMFTEEVPEEKKIQQDKDIDLNHMSYKKFRGILNSFRFL